MRPLLPLPMLFALLAGCGGRERCDNGRDDDGDGFVDCDDQDCSDECGERCGNGVDDDADLLIDCLDPDCAGTCTPTAAGERCDNGVDDDGDWLIDCADDDCRTTCDADDDGFLAEAVGGDDCDDQRPGVNPEALEVPYDGLDQDCDPATPDDDLDGDGFLAEDDCDDAVGERYPGAPETCGNGGIDDCDATAAASRAACFTDRSVLTADATLLGNSSDGWAGYSLASAGDVNGDGFGDLVIGAYGEGADHTGSAYLVLGPVTGSLDLATAQVKWTGESEDDWAGFAVAPGGDLTGNGIPDLIIGARYDDATGHNAGAAYVVRTDASGTVELSSAVAKIFAEGEYDSAGYSVAGPGDVDGDGQDDLLIGALFNLQGGLNAGAAYVVMGPIVGPQHLEQAEYKLVGELPNDNAGCAVGAAGDLDGDGQGDLVVGACLSDRSFPNGGAAYQFSTHVLGERRLSAADGAMVGEAAQDQLGFAVAGAGDLDGDGRADLVIGAPLHDLGGVDAGAAYVARGPATINMNQPSAKIVGEAAGDRAGTSVTGVGDVDGDGFDDLAIGAPGSDLGGEDAGVAYLLFGPVSGSISLADATVRLIGDGAFDFTGQAVAGAGDVDGDGHADLLVGSPFRDGLAPAGGAAHLFTFQP